MGSIGDAKGNVSGMIMKPLRGYRFVAGLIY